jgi:hypothetical protein
VAPHVAFERRHIEITNHNGALVRRRPQVTASTHLIQKRELVGEFPIDRRIRNIAAGRNVEIVQRDRVRQSGPLAERDRDMPAVALAAIVADRRRLERQSRNHHHAVVAFLAVERDVLIAKSLEALARKTVVRTLGLLQAQDIGAHRFDEFGDQIDAETHRIDVPGGERYLHGDGLSDPNHMR